MHYTGVKKMEFFTAFLNKICHILIEFAEHFKISETCMLFRTISLTLRVNWTSRYFWIFVKFSIKKKEIFTQAKRGEKDTAIYW